MTMEMYDRPWPAGRISAFFCLGLALFLIFCLGACNLDKEHLFYGKTMGTTYHIKVVSHGFDNPAHLKDKITKCLDRINQSMSTYIKDSEISRFNRSTALDTPFPISADFLNVMQVARTLYQQTGGAWDGTIKPLIDLWGFTRPAAVPEIPADRDIKRILARMGFDKIHIDPAGNLTKTQSDVTVDLASIAKGYGVDAVARVIQENGYMDYIVEIGGEVYASGKTAEGLPWRVGINTPDSNAGFNAVYEALTVANQGVATSGDYRNFFEKEGRRYSHILDPRTGYPVAHNVVSVTIVADTCTFADGLATAVMVMGEKDGLALINRIDRTEGLIITRSPDGTFSDHASNGFLK